MIVQGENGRDELLARIEEPRKPHHEAQAAVLLASGRARELARIKPWPPVPDLDVHIEDGIAFTRVVEETETPLFVVYDAAEPDVMRKAMGDWNVRDMHGIALDAVRSSPRREHDAAPRPWRSTHVTAAGLGGGGRSDVVGVRLAVAVELDRRARDLSFHDRAAVLLRARGIGPDADADAWAALYDRAWGMGLVPWRAVLISGTGQKTRPSPSFSADYSASHASAREPGWAAHALFQEPRFFSGTMTETLMAESRSTAAILIGMEQREETDLERHRFSITRLLERQRWGIEDEDFRNPDALLVVKGGQAEFQLMVRPNGILQPEWKRQSLLEVDLLSVDRLLVSGPAPPSAVLSHLAGSGELMVGMRDLATLDVSEATSLTIVAAQLRRMVKGLPSSARTHFIALVAMQAFRGGRVDEAAQGLLGLIERPELGREVHLAVGSTTVAEGGLAAKIRIIDGNRERGRRWHETDSFVMILSSASVTITSIDWDSQQY